MSNLDFRKDPDLDLPFQNLGWLVNLSGGIKKHKTFLVLLVIFLFLLLFQE